MLEVRTGRWKGGNMLFAMVVPFGHGLVFEFLLLCVGPAGDWLVSDGREGWVMGKGESCAGVDMQELREQRCWQVVTCIRHANVLANAECLRNGCVPCFWCCHQY